MDNSKRYKVINTTIKPLKTNAKGEDIRPITDRVGYGIQFRLDNPEELVTLYAGQSRIVDRLNDGLFKLFRKHLVRIELIHDIADELQIFAKKTEAPVPAPESVAAPVVPEDIKARSYPMGETRGEEKLVNPDGEPNFVAKAPKGGLTRQKRADALE